MLGGWEWPCWEGGSGHVGKVGVVVLGRWVWSCWEGGSGHVGKVGVVVLGRWVGSCWEGGSGCVGQVAWATLNTIIYLELQQTEFSVTNPIGTRPETSYLLPNRYRQSNSVPLTTDMLTDITDHTLHIQHRYIGSLTATTQLDLVTVTCTTYPVTQ